MSAILFLAHRLPWPPDRGDRIRSWHVLKHLAARHDVHVIAPHDHPDDLAALPVIEAIAASVTTVQRPPSRGAAIRRALVRGTPASVEAFQVPALQQAVMRRLAEHPIRAIYAFSGQMAAYVPQSWGRRAGQRFVMDFVDVDSAKFAQQGETHAGLVGAAHRFEARRLARWEAGVARRADQVLFVSEAEAALFRASSGLTPDQAVVAVSGNGIDAEAFDPGPISPQPLAGFQILFTGQMDYGPNVQAVGFFADQILPVLRAQLGGDVRFTIVGREPAAAIRAMGERPGITVTGAVPDVRPWLAAAHLVVAPLFLARGVQNKVLEAMAMARPVIASPGAAAGIDARIGAELLVADTAQDWVERIRALHADPARCRTTGMAARARVVADYAWSARLATLDPLCGDMG